jgi:hypothetical protein
LFKTGDWRWDLVFCAPEEIPEKRQAACDRQQ